MIRKIMIAGMLGISLLSLAGCGKVPAGNVGVKVYLLGGSKGVDSEVLTPGRYFIGWNEDLYLFPTFTQNYVWTKDSRPGSETDESFTFQTKEGMAVTADIGISYAIRPESVSTIFQKYRRGVDEITDTFLRNMVRDALVVEASKLPIESVYGAGKEDLIKSVENRVKSQVNELGINIERIYWINSLELPPEVVGLINAKIGATQKTQQRQNEIEQVKAEAQKAIEEARGLAESVKLRAQAEAEANRIINQSLTDDLVRYKALEKWDGVLPRMTGGGAVPFIDVEKTISNQ